MRPILPASLLAMPLRSLLRPGASSRPRRALLAALALTLFGAPAPAHAWDDVGHMTIAAIAWERLSPRARAAAAALLRAAPPDAGLAQLRPNEGGPEARDRALFLRAATWPDIVRDRREAERMRRYHRSTWHYMDTFWRQGGDGRPLPVTGLPTNPENAAERLVHFGRTVGDVRRPAAERAVELAWILHLVGDIHQPLHAGSRVTASEPEGDRGGNAVRLGSTNLHSIWDDALDRSPGRRPRGRGGRPSGDEAKLDRALRNAERLARALPASRVAPALADTAPASWARAGLALAQREVYTPEVGEGAPSVPPGYRERVRRVAEPAATLAGYRLAALLERALGGR